MAENTVDLGDLLDTNLDDLADLPEFKPFPNGTHKAVMRWEQKKIGESPALEMKLKAIETLELAEPGKDQPLEAGAETSVLYMLDNEFGQGAIKEIVAPALAEALGVTQLRALIDGSQGMEVIVTTKIRMNKDKTQSYTDVKKLMVA